MASQGWRESLLEEIHRAPHTVNIMTGMAVSQPPPLPSPPSPTNPTLQHTANIMLSSSFTPLCQPYLGFTPSRATAVLTQKSAASGMCPN